MEGVMVRRVLAGAASAVVLFLAIPIAVSSAGAPAGAAPPPAIRACQNGGWQTQTDASGKPLKNHGQCISYAIHNPVSLSDLANSSITGTTSAIFPPDAGCGGTLASQVFDSIYSGTAPLGAVQLHVAGCLDATLPPPNLHYAGTFTIATHVGTLSGTAAGPVNVDLTTFDFTFHLTLSAMTGTGSFAAMTGNMQLVTVVDNFVAGPPAFTFSGAVAVQ